MTLGKIVNLVDRVVGSNTVLGAAAGTTTLALDSVIDFHDLGGFVTINGAALGYVTRDNVLKTITLVAPLGAPINVGQQVNVFPPAKEKWALVALESSGANDAVWCMVPHTLTALLAATGYREQEDRESVEFAPSGTKQVIIDVLSKKPEVQAEAIPDGLITETMIGPGSITTPLLAANAVTAINMDADSVSARAVQGDAIDGMTITAPLIQSAPSSYTGRRTESGSFGFRVIGPDLGGGIPRTVEVSLGGDKNLFRGSVEAVDMIVNDKLQLYGVNNYMGIGAKLTLQTRVTAPGQPPGISFDYEERAKPGGGAYMTGAWWNAAENQSAATELYYKTGWIQRNGVPWPIPTVDVAPGDTWSERMPWSSCRIAEVAGNGLMVTMHEKRATGDTGFPKRMVGVWDDAAVPGGGAPVLKGELEIEPFNWLRSVVVAPRLFASAGSRTTFAAVIWDQTAKTIEWRDYNYTTAGGLVLTGFSGAGVLSVSNWVSGEELIAAEFGTSTALGVPDNGVPQSACIVLHTNKSNYVYFYNGSVYVLQPNAMWPIPFSDQREIFRSYDPYVNSMSQFYSATWAAGADQKVYKYQKNMVWGDETWWVNYAWRGNTASPALITPPSLKASQPFRKGARLNVNVPSLPAPQAGVGNPRDPLKDVYGWFYYIGKGASDPANSGMFKQTVQPTGDPTTVTAITLSSYPVLSGTNPNVLNGFPTASAAAIVSSAVDGGGVPLMSIDGNGLIFGDTITAATKVKTPSLEQVPGLPDGANLGAVWNPIQYGIAATFTNKVWIRTGKLIECWATATVTLIGGSGTIAISPPTTLHSSMGAGAMVFVGRCQALRQGVTFLQGDAMVESATKIGIWSQPNGQWTPTWPYTWQVGDLISWHFSYREA